MSLTSWHDIPFQDRSIAVYGDSTMEGTVNISNGGITEQLRVLMEPRWSRGGSGLHGVWRNDWAYTQAGNAWTSATSSDAWDVGPLGPGIFPVTAVQFANGATKTATWTKPEDVTAKQFTIYAVDGPGTSNFSYSLNGGSNWTNVAHTWSQNNSLVAIQINFEVTSTLIIRAANAAGSATNTYLVGVEAFANEAGVTVHNLGGNGEIINTAVRPSAVGDWTAWLDLVQPELVIIERYTNDVIFWTIGGENAGFRTMYQTLIDTVTGYGGEVLLLNFFEQDVRDVTAQAEMRAQHHELAVENDIPIVDMYQVVQGGFAVANAAGYMSDGLHPSDSGAVLMAQQIWKIIAKSGRGAKVRVG